tara:strand:+ start:673 stop:867 length:195 start_codon:yes stop_codon:yes gene_type:complete
MTVNDGTLSLLKNKIREHMNGLADHLAIGGAQSMEEYRKICGTIEGLAWMEREILELDEKLGEL